MFVGQYIIGRNLAQTRTKIMKIKEEANISLVGECMDTLIGEALSMAVLDSECTKTV